jgi:hypothetical protein
MARETNVVLRCAVLAALVAAIPLLAGCGGDDGSDSPATESGSAQAGTEQTGGPTVDVEDFGEEASPEDRDAAATTVQGFLGAQADGDSATACSLMSTSTKENLELFLEGEARESVENSCAELVEALRAQIPAKTLAQGERVEVTGVRIEGDRGYVLYRDAEGTDSAFAVVREGSAWKVGVIVGTPLP